MNLSLLPSKSKYLDLLVLRTRAHRLTESPKVGTRPLVIVDDEDEEDLSDEAFLKRHAKAEAKEKLAVSHDKKQQIENHKRGYCIYLFLKKYMFTVFPNVSHVFELIF